MNFVHSKSQCTKTELDLFSVPLTQVTLEKGHLVDHQTVSSVTDDGAITFLSTVTEHYVDLSKTILLVRAEVTKPNGSNLGDSETGGVVDNFLHSLFKQVDVYLKQKQATQATGTYAIPSICLNYGSSATRSQLTADAGANLGLNTRYEFSKKSGTIKRPVQYSVTYVFVGTSPVKFCGPESRFELK